jgi:flagellar assembly factor FliW
MILSTLRFGELEIQEQEIVIFQYGLPGFEHLRQFVFVMPDTPLPFAFMQSVEQGETAFIVADPFLFFSDYDFELNESDKDELGIDKVEQVRVWSIVTVRERIEEATLNLLAPVVLNASAKRGKQIILGGTEYQTRHRIPLVSTENTSQTKTPQSAKEGGTC